MKKYIISMVLALVALTACEKQWDNVPEKDYTTLEDIKAEGYTPMSVKDFKQEYFYKELPNPGKTVKGVLIEDKVVLTVKVISSDELGNTYKSLYVQDAAGPENGGLELKIGKGSLYTVYKPGQVLYIKCDELILGNYCNMLGLGGPSSEAKYSNGFIDIQTIIDEKILPSNQIGFVESDTKVVNSSNIADFVTNHKKYLGTLCRFDGVTSTWGMVKVGGYDNLYPSFSDADNQVVAYDENGTEIKNDSNYNKDYALYGLPATWAYSYDNVFLYGSCVFTLGGNPFVVRTSGYSRFALEEIPANGAKCDITAVFTIYDRTYQLVLNTHEDVVVK
ncbi:MAG: hypothetical protein IKY63_00670 [Tidjanibacter sp.]|nr:hypothetical protein [Tidjanibacter sp.]